MKMFRRYHSAIHGNYRRAYLRCGLLAGVLLALYVLVRHLLRVPMPSPESYATDGILLAAVVLLALLYRNSLDGRRATLKELMLFGMGTALVASLLYGLFLWGYGLSVPTQTAVFATATTGATPAPNDPQIHYWAAFCAIVATIKLTLIGGFGAFLAALFLRNEKSEVRQKNKDRQQ